MMPSTLVLPLIVAAPSRRRRAAPRHSRLGVGGGPPAAPALAGRPLPPSLAVVGLRLRLVDEELCVIGGEVVAAAAVVARDVVEVLDGGHYFSTDYAQF